MSTRLRIFPLFVYSIPCLLLLSGTACQSVPQQPCQNASNCTETQDSPIESEPPSKREYVHADRADLDLAFKQSVQNISGADTMIMGIAFEDGSHWVSTHNTSNAEVSRESLFRIGSITKTILATNILMLVDRGELSLDMAISEWTPELNNANEITIRMLLNHTSGLPNYSATRRFQEIVLSDPNFSHTFESLTEIILETPNEFAPGVEHAYSNTNYIVLGHILEQVENKSWFKSCDDNIFDTLRLESFQIDHDGAPDALLPGYSDALSGMLENVRDAYSGSWAGAAGQLIANTDDLLAFFQDHFVGKLLLTESSQSEQINYSPQSQNSYGLGTIAIPFGSTMGTGHNGNIFGYCSFAAANPTTGVSVVLFDNTCSPDSNNVLIDVLSAAELL